MAGIGFSSRTLEVAVMGDLIAMRFPPAPV
jgi:hypothetical protein